MMSVSTFSRRLLITEILLETLDPPRIATNGLSGSLLHFRGNRSLSASGIRQLLCQHTVLHLRLSSELCELYRMHRLQIRRREMQLFGECFAVLCLFCSVTCVLKKYNISVVHSLYSRFCVRPYNFRISCDFTSCPSSSESLTATRCKRKPRLRLPSVSEVSRGLLFLRQRSAS